MAIERRDNPLDRGVPLSGWVLFALVFPARTAFVRAGMGGMAKLPMSRLRPTLTMAVGKREDPSCWGDSLSEYFVTFRLESGETRGYPLRAGLFTVLREGNPGMAYIEGNHVSSGLRARKGDIGVAYIKGDRLLDFKRVRLPKA